MAEMVLPFGFVFTVYTEATGYVANGEFMGMLSFDYAYQLIRGRPTGNPQIDHMLQSAPATARVTGTGTFRIIVAE